MTIRRAYIGLGANQGDPRKTFAAALAALTDVERCEFVAVSPLYLTAPVEADGPDFLNAVVALDTDLEPYGLLLHLQDIEFTLGRDRVRGEARNAPRLIDLDLLLLGRLVFASAPLTLPHPRLGQRAFVLKPLLDLAPEIEIPGLGLARELLPAVESQRAQRVDDQLLAGPAPAAGRPDGAAAADQQ
jgi:2-amino-4-hydroxy-6-hydroxymethyldihydropteridine diphosphokinase